MYLLKKYLLKKVSLKKSILEKYRESGDDSIFASGWRSSRSVYTESWRHGFQTIFFKCTDSTVRTLRYFFLKKILEDTFFKKKLFLKETFFKRNFF